MRIYVIYEGDIHICLYYYDANLNNFFFLIYC